MQFIGEVKNSLKDSDIESFILNTLDFIKSIKNVLLIHPDYTRNDFTSKIVPIILKELKSRGADRFDFLNAAGTHRKMTEKEFLQKLGIDKKENFINFYNHEFDKPENLITVGKISSAFVRKKTNGQLDESIQVYVNKQIFKNYDLIIAISGTAPHEATGFSGGLKIFFPGISESHMIDLFHWASALVGIPEIIGKVDNVARDILNEGASYLFKNLRTTVISFNMVSIEENSKCIPIGLYNGIGFNGFINAYEAASSKSSKFHLKFIDRPLKQVVQVIPEYYDEIWTAAKGSYKLQRPGVMAECGEIILYAPHINYFHSNKSMNNDIQKVGYHCRDYIKNYLLKYPGYCKNSAAHLMNVIGPGVYNVKKNKEKLYFKLTLSTSIPKDVCKAVCLGYRDPKTIRKEDFMEQGKLWIEDGGKYLYDLINSGKCLV